MAAAKVSVQQVAAHGLSAVDWLRAGAIVAGAILLAQLARRVSVRTLQRGDSERFVAHMVGRVLAYAVVVAGLVYALSALDVRIAPLLGALGIGGIALAFALQD